ncbi:MAG: hypothetical protein ACUVYA_06435 [Planctomycetota bacterium]
MRSERNDREQLEQELRGGAYQALLQKLQRTHLFFRRFRTWGDVIAFMREGTSIDPRKDEILRPIFEAHAQDGDPRWRAILLVIFWPGLESIHFQKRRWDPDPDELWQNIVWTFLQVLCRLDVRRRPDRLVRKIFNDTVHHLYDDYRHAWDRANRELTTDPEKIEALAGGTECIDTASIELRQAQEIEIQHLREHLDGGRITEADFLLLIGTRVYGKSVADYAREVGLDYQVAKKRRQRAEAVIRRFEDEKR